MYFFCFYPCAQASRVVIGLVSVYIYIYIYMSSKKIVIERTRDLIYLKFVVTDFSPKITSHGVLVKTPLTQRSPCYSAVSALLMNPLPDRSNYSPLCHTHYLTPDQYFIFSSGQTLYQAASWRLYFKVHCCSAVLQNLVGDSVP